MSVGRIEIDAEGRERMRLATAMLVAAITASACAGGDTNESAVATSAPITTEVPESTTTTKVPIVGGPTTRHDGECTYEGPTEFDLNSDVTFTFINASEVLRVGFSVWKVLEGTATEDIYKYGVHGVTDEGEDHYFPYLNTSTAPGIEWPLTVTFDKAGLHALICFELPGDRPDYAATLFTVSG
jgi:hypothetical protein